MPGSPETIPLGECTLLSPSPSSPTLHPLPLRPPGVAMATASRSESTVFSLSRSGSLWAGEPAAAARGPCQAYWMPIHLMATGGSFLACGLVISGLFFAGHCRVATGILGPALLSIGLMVLVVGVVLIPVTRDNRKQPAPRRVLPYYRPPQFNL